MIEYVVPVQLRIEELVEGLAARMREAEEGQDLIEYALLAALISIVAIVAMRALGTQISALFTYISTQLGNA